MNKERQKSEVRRQKSEVRGQKAEVRRQKAEVRGQKGFITIPIAQAFWQPEGSKGYNSPLNFFQWLVFRGKWICIALLVCLGLGCYPAPAQAHGFQTSYLELREQPSGQVEVVWKTPSAMSFGDEGLSSPMTISPVFPSHCTGVTVPKVMATPTTRITRWTLDCGKNGLAEETIAFPGLLQSSLEVLLRVEWADGHSQTTMVPTGEETFVIPEKTTVFAVGQTYLKLGVEHIFSGIDHLLFVLGLVLIVGPSWRLVKTITAFTLAHSITLGAATLGLVNVPQAPVEAVIALSILFLASELAHSRQGKPGLTEQYPWLVALTFGLLHGFGFAGALAEVGLPPQDIPPALLFFNVGVELGQLAFVLVVVAVMESLKRFGSENYPRWLGWVPTYSIGILASFWCFQRVAAFWG
ncbi:HupE/UreJ family protein [Moorena sp. SIO3A2]|uniref:HupE/UreJ family protein n=1 Tax=Moorena sp. SIO3A2 TaxID=2607841 RepID=UPI00257EE249|nr:HupE/UreJ family protein [Moorena sp. SIO3A2]